MEKPGREESDSSDTVSLILILQYEGFLSIEQTHKVIKEKIKKFAHIKINICVQ